MAHHSSQQDNDFNSLFVKQMLDGVRKMQEEANKLGLGPTGQFPEGQLVDHDEGEIRIAITTYQGKVIVNFGSPVAFIGFTPEQATEIGEMLIKHADSLVDQGRRALGEI